MARQQAKKNVPGWRSRREEYLRASGRQSDLIMEGFERAPATAGWTIIAGRQASRPTEPNPRAGLFLAASSWVMAAAQLVSPRRPR